MTFNLKVDRETVSAVIGVIVLVYTFITLMWFPSVFLGTVWALFVLFGSVVIAAMVAAGIYNLLGSILKDDEDSDEE